MMHEAISVGVNVGHAHSRSEWAEKARKVEDLGYDILTVPDHLTDVIAPLPALISAAEATKRLRVATKSSTTIFVILSWWRERPRQSIC